MADLDILLNELNDWLKGTKLELELIIIGAYAVHLHGITARATMDVDTLKAIKNTSIQKKIDEIGEKYGLDSWLNNQAEGLILPDNFFKHTLKSNKFSNINIQYSSRADLISLKVAAFYYRHETELKDLDDLKLLKPTNDEFSNAKNFLKTKHLPEQESFKESFLSDVELITYKLNIILNE